MAEEHEKHPEKKFLKLPKLSKWDFAAIAALVIFLVLVLIPVYIPKGECEIARPAYKCASARSVMIENCEYWGKFECDSSKDISLPQVEWYIGNLCKIANRNHNYGYNCANLKSTCNQVTEKQTCPVFG